MRVHTEKEIIICNACNGIGHKNEYIRTSGYDSEAKLITCKECEGTGRLIKTTILESFKGSNYNSKEQDSYMLNQDTSKFVL
jgi:DnaJ-class molecular chaperone